MKIALVIPSIAFQGEIETPVVRVFAERIGAAVDLHLFPVFLPTGTHLRRVGKLTVHPVMPDKQHRFSRRLARIVASIRREHTRAPFDLIHAIWLHEPGTIAIAAGAALGVPVVASVGGAEVVAMPEIAYGALRDARGRFMTALVLQRATIVTGGSRYAVRLAERVVPHRQPDRFRRAPLPVSASMFAAPRRRSYDPDAPRLLHAASLIPVKDQPTLLRAFRRVAAAIPGAHLTIVGDDPFAHRADLERMRSDCGLSRVVTFAGSRPHAEMPAIYHQSDLLVVSSRHESQGMVVLEAAAAGVPTVGTAVGVVPDLAPDAAIPARPGDPVALADAIVGLLRDPVRLARMAERARQRALHEYDATVAGRTFLNVYEDASGRSRR